MAKSRKLAAVLLSCSAMLVLAACGSGGADGVASPGEGAFPPPPPAPPPAPPPPTTTPGGAALDCPTGFANQGVIANDSLRVCGIPNAITGNFLVPARAGTAYAINGRVDVGQDQGGDANAPRAGAAQGILTIEPGVTLFGSQGLDYVVVNRGSRIVANGTASAPIVFTSRASLDGPTANGRDPVNAIGEWGGLVILGRAPINNCPGTTTPGSATCESQVEGTNAFFGGNAPGDTSGTLNYVRVMHSGFRVIADNELNGITFAGVGAGTTVSHVQVHNSSDDGIEWFGGTMNARYLVLTGNDDDSLDTDQGYNGALQFVIAIQRTGGGDNIIEASNAGGAARAPVSNPKIANFTFIPRTGANNNLTFNTATQFRLLNGVLAKPASATNPCIDIDSGATPQFDSVFFTCITLGREESDTPAAEIAERFNSGSNNTPNGTSTLQNGFVNGPNESGRPAFANLGSISPFFQQVSYIGAVRDGADNWFQGWTCGLPGQNACP